MKTLKIILINVCILVALTALLNGIFFLLLGLKNEGSTGDYPYEGKRRALLMNNGKDSLYNLSVMDDFYSLETEYRPYVVWSRKSYKGKTTTVNEEGDRVTFLDSSRITDSSPVLRVFGGSTVWGTGVDDHGTIPAYLYTYLQEHIVLNHGESGFVSRQSLARLINLLNQGEKTDGVVFYEGFNDIMTLCRQEVGYNSHDRAIQINTYIEQAKKASSAKSVVKEFVALIFYRYTLQYFADKKAITGDENQMYKCCTDPASLEKVAGTLVRNWRLAHQLCEANKISFHAYLQPCAYTGNPVFDPRYKITGEHCMPETYNKVCEFIHAELKNETWYHDLRNALDNKGPFYIDGCHISDQGNELIAGEIYRLGLKGSADSTGRITQPAH